jgi:predicted PurR-regulated permease PerM
MNNHDTLSKYVWGLLAVILTGFIFIYLKDFLQPIMIAILFSATILPWVKFLIRWKIPETLAILFCLVIVYALFFFFSWWLYQSLTIFQNDYPILQTKAIQFLKDFDLWLHNYRFDFDIFIPKMNEILLKGSEIIGITLLTVSGLAGNLILATVYAFLMLLYRRNMYLAFESILGENRKENTYSFFKDLSETLSGYLMGLIKVQCIVFVIIWVLLTISGVPHSLFFALITAILNVIPYIGIFSVGITVALFSLLMFGSWGLMIWVFVIFWLTHVLEANWITPKIMGKIMNLNPLATILFIILGSHLWGFWGMILAIPMTATIRIILEHSRSLKKWALFLKE